VLERLSKFDWVRALCWFKVQYQPRLNLQNWSLYQLFDLGKKRICLWHISLGSFHKICPPTKPFFSSLTPCPLHSPSWPHFVLNKNVCPPLEFNAFTTNFKAYLRVVDWTTPLLDFWLHDRQNRFVLHCDLLNKARGQFLGEGLGNYRERAESVLKCLGWFLSSFI
jgi:hypothetical protein